MKLVKNIMIFHTVLSLEMKRKEEHTKHKHVERRR
jgi:hypothetical protein